MKKHSAISVILCACIVLTMAFSACNTVSKSDTADGTAAPAATDPATADSAAINGIDYMALVNKTHPLPDDWEDKLVTVHMNNSVGDDVEVEKKAYDAYLELKKALEADGVFVDLDSARRSVADQQRIMDEFTEQYGADYAAKTVAKPGLSEHHTGLALDLYLIIDGKDVVENEDMMQYPEIWDKIHAKLAGCGFILRYLKGKEYITGYGYEPWHIRYIDDPAAADQINSKGITFEEYLGVVSDYEPTIDCGESALYSQEELEAAVVQIECQFAFWEGCELHSIRYAGDAAVTDEVLKRMNERAPETPYTQAAGFLMDFHSSKESGDSSFERDHEYKDYEWWLAKNSEGGWDIVSYGKE